MKLQWDNRGLTFRPHRLIGVMTCTLALWTAALGCAPSEEEIQEEFAAEVERSNDCAADSECVIATPLCPLGCWVIVNAKHKARVEHKARELVEDYESGGQSCVYDCDVAPPAACINGECAAAP